MHISAPYALELLDKAMGPKLRDWFAVHPHRHTLLGEVNRIVERVVLHHDRHSPDAQQVASVIASIDRIVAERKEAGRYDAAVGHILPRHISIPTLARILEHLRDQGLDVDTRTAAPMAAAGFTDMIVSWRRQQASALSFNIADKDTRQTVMDGTRGGQNPYLLTSDHSDAWVFGNFCAKNNITGVVTKKRNVWTVNGKSYKVYGAEVRPYHT